MNGECWKKLRWRGQETEFDKMCTKIHQIPELISKAFTLMHQINLIIQFDWIILNHRYKVEASSVLMIEPSLSTSVLDLQKLCHSLQMDLWEGRDIVNCWTWETSFPASVKSEEHLYLSFSEGSVELQWYGNNIVGDLDCAESVLRVNASREEGAAQRTSDLFSDLYTFGWRWGVY